LHFGVLGVFRLLIAFGEKLHDFRGSLLNSAF
jgi:hypothetical protein